MKYGGHVKGATSRGYVAGDGVVGAVGAQAAVGQHCA